MGISQQKPAEKAKETENVMNWRRERKKKCEKKGESERLRKKVKSETK